MTHHPQREPGPDDDAAIDVASGVERVMGDQHLFARILERFRCDYRRAAAAIRAALASGDSALAQRLVHTLKGAAGMIEARTLQREALALEQALGGRGGDCGPRLDRLDTELDRVLRELDALLAAPDQRPIRAASAAAPLAPGEAATRLAALLGAGDGAAVDLVEEAGAALSAALGEARFGAVAEAVGAFDFERALALLKS